MNKILNIENNFALFLVFFLVSFIFLCFAFMPLLTIPCAQHDDYNFFAWGPREGLLSHPQALFTLFLGRPIKGVLASFFMRFVDTPADFAPIRAIYLFFAALSTALLTVYLKKAKIGNLPVLFTSIAIFLLPGMQYYILVILSSPMLLGVFFALVSMMFLEKVSAKDLLSLRLFVKPYSLLFTIFSFLFLLAALLSYQVTTMFFLVPTLILVLFRDIDKWKETRLIVLRDLVLLGTAIITFFLVHRCIVLPYLFAKYPQASHVVGPGSKYQFMLSINVLQKMAFFIKNLSFQSLNLWSIYPTLQIAFGVLLFIIIGVIAALWKMICKATLRRNYWSVAQASVVILFLIILSNLPNLAAAGGYPAYRTIFPYTAMIIILLIWSAKSLLGFLSEKWQLRAIWVVACGMLVISIFCAHYNMLNVAVNNHLELSYLRAAIAEEINNKPSSVHIIAKSHIHKSFLNLPQRYDEFNKITEAFPLMIYSFLKKEGPYRDGVIKTENYPTISCSRANEKTIYIPSDSIVVNMDALEYPLYNYSVTPLDWYEIIYVDVSAAAYWPDHYYSGGYIGARAFDGIAGGDSYWQVMEGYPQWLKITYPEPRKVLRYKLQIGDFPERMVKSWTLQGSEDGNIWIDIDLETDQTNWKANEKRDYKIDKSGNYKYYRFFITEGNDIAFLRIDEIKMIFEEN